MARTFLVVRDWCGLHPDFDRRQFDDCPDEKLPDAVRVAALAWAKRKRIRIPRRGSPVTAEFLDRVGPFLGFYFITNRWAEVPKWRAFHYEDNPRVARDILRLLRKLDFLDAYHTMKRLRFKALNASSLSRSARAQRSHESENLPPRPAYDSGTDLLGTAQLLASLKQKAIDLSKVVRDDGAVAPTRRIDQTPVPGSVGPHRDLQSTSPTAWRSVLPTSTENRFADLPPRERLAFQQFLEACSEDEELSKWKATEAHWNLLKARDTVLPAFPSWRKNVSEALRKVHGRARQRRPLLTRSVGTAAELDVIRGE